MKDNKNQQAKQKSKAPEKLVAKAEKGLFHNDSFALGKENYILMAIGALAMIVGYFFMAGQENIMGFQKTGLSVIFVMFGFGFMIYAIMKKPKNKEE